MSLLESIITKVNELQQSILGLKDDVDEGNRRITACKNYLKELIEKKMFWAERKTRGINDSLQNNQQNTICEWIS